MKKNIKNIKQKLLFKLEGYCYN